MDQKRIDRLFREKLDGMEVTPSARSWEMVERQISHGSQGVPKVYWAAASVIVLVGWLTWPSDLDETLTPMASEINHPAFAEVPGWTLPVLARSDESLNREEMTQIPVAKVEAVNNEQKDDAQPDTQEVELLAPTPFLELERKAVVVKAQLVDPGIITELEMVKPAETANSAFRITYIGSNDLEMKQERDSVSGIKKFIARAGKFSPGEVLADIRTAKSDFLNGGLKNKQKDKRSL